MVVATLENSALIFSLREFHENLCNRKEYRNFRFCSDLAKQISLGSLPVKFGTLSMLKAKGLFLLNYVPYKFSNLSYSK